MKKTLLTLSLICSALFLKAQDDKISYKFDYGKSSAKDGGAKFFDNNLTLRIPIQSGLKSRFTVGAEVDVLSMSSTASQADANPLETVGLIFGYMHLMQGKIFTIHAEPMLASDFQQLSANDFRFKSQAIILLNTDHKFAYGLGLGYQYQFSGSQLIPVLTTIWRISDHVTLSGLLPIIPRLDFKLNQKWSIGGGINGDYSSYRLNAFNNRYIQYQNWNFGLTGKYKPTPRFEIGALLGVGTRHITIYNADQKVPLRIYSWNIGGGSHVPDFDQKYKGLALNFSMAYKIP
jgi:hypothetical protein